MDRRPPGVTTVIPGASSVRQAQANAAASDEPVDDAALGAIRELYDEAIRPLVHERW